MKIPKVLQDSLQYFEVESLDRDTPVHINLPTESLNYEVYGNESKHFLYNTKGNNDKIFYMLGIGANKQSFVSKIVGYNTTGGFPEVKSKEDLLKVIIALDEECVKKFGDKQATSSDFKVGDRIVVLPKVKEGSLYNPIYTDFMMKYAGETAIITSVSKNSCKLDIDGGTFYWSREALKLSDEAICKEASKPESKAELNLLPRKKKHYQLDFNIH